MEAQGPEDGVLSRPLRVFLEIFFRCLRVPDHVTKMLSVESNELRGLFERRINEDDMDRSSGFENG